MDAIDDVVHIIPGVIPAIYDFMMENTFSKGFKMKTSAAAANWGEYLKTLMSKNERV